MKKIWIDITNTPEANFFEDFIIEWGKKYEVIVTARSLSNTLELLDKNGIQYHVVGSHYGKKKIAKIFGFFKRCSELYSFLKSKNIDIAFSHSSFYSPYVAKKLNIPCIYANDNEFANGNYVGFIFAQYILFPEALKKWTQGRFFEKKVTFFPGVKEGIYLRNVYYEKTIKRPPTIYFRPEPWNAEYHEFISGAFDSMLADLSKEFKIIIMPRDKAQTEHYKKLSLKHTNLLVPSKVQTVDKIAEDCDVFLGAGGSMTREFAFMGIPTVSMYPDKTLEVDQYLIDHGVLASEKDSSKIDADFIYSLIDKREQSDEVYKSLQEKGKQTRGLINSLIENTLLKNAEHTS